MSGPIVSFHANVLGTQELAAKFKQLEEAVQEQYLVTATQSGGQVILNAAQDNILTQGLVRTRNLSRSMHMEVTDQSAQSATVEVGTDLEYAAIHEFGGVIQAKNGKYLAIPVNGAVGSPTKRSDLKVRKTAGGILVLVDPGGIVQYILETSVEIPAQPYLRPAADEHGDEAQAEVGKALAILIEQAAVQ
jgi:HK97 gp10 family phage protein